MLSTIFSTSIWISHIVRRHERSGQVGRFLLFVPCMHVGLRFDGKRSRECFGGSLEGRGLMEFIDTDGIENIGITRIWCGWIGRHGCLAKGPWRMDDGRWAGDPGPLAPSHTTLRMLR